MAESATAEMSPETWPGPIPHTLSRYLCIDFVNSRFTNHTGTGEVYDRLEMPQWRHWFTQRASLAVPRPPTPSEHRELVSLRHLLRELLQSRHEPSARTRARINRDLSRSPASWQLLREGPGVQLRLGWRSEDWHAVIAAALASYCDLLTSGQISQVRRCANPHCSYLFFDESRNLSRRWCDPAACGNLLTVRKHRQRTRS